MTAWTASEEARFAVSYERGDNWAAMRAAFPGRSDGSFRGKSRVMNLHRPANPESVVGLTPDHRAVIGGRTIFPSRVRAAASAPALLAPGEYQRKLGSVISKGAWRGMPVFSLTLEERATCPRSCGHFRTCYGNGTPLAWRNRHGGALERLLERELSALQRRYSGGFVVRLHILGDFYSAPYVELWRGWLARFPALRVFGYTAWPPSTAIGAAVADLAHEAWDRFAVRLSDVATTTLWEIPDQARMTELARDGVIVCPAQTGRTKSCSTCGLCWAAPEKTIAFIAHGPSWSGRGKKS